MSDGELLQQAGAAVNHQPDHAIDHAGLVSFAPAPVLLAPAWQVNDLLMPQVRNVTNAQEKQITTLKIWPQNAAAMNHGCALHIKQTSRQGQLTRYK